MLLFSQILSPPVSESIDAVVIIAQPDFPIELGARLTLTCSVDAIGLTDIIWTENRIINTNNEVETNISNGVSTLTIPFVLSQDLGSYSCQAVAGSIFNIDTATVTATSK